MPEPAVPSPRRTPAVTPALAAVPVLMALLANAGLASPAAMPPAALAAAAEAAARRHASERAGPDARITVTATPPDPRLRLAPCASPPLAAVAPGGGLARLTVAVSCRQPTAWRVYVPVTVTATRPVVVAARSLARDTILAPGDVRLAERDVASLPYGSFASDREVVGQRLRRELAVDAVLSPGLVLAPALVHRGQAVLMEARAPGFSVRMAGVARRDGRLGETIPVENISSGEVRDAVVRSAKSVEVLTR
jgi:flagella basal body P-ring formation protein FlgA